MSKKALTLALSVLTVTLFTLPFISQKSEREAYIEYLRNHPYNPQNTQSKGLHEMPEQDRPDLAWEQNYLMTMDPALKRPTPEKLEAGRKQIRDFFEQKAKSRTGTEDFPWEERGPLEIGGRTRAVMWDPNDPEGDKVWAGGVSGGLWVNENIFDATSPWKKVDDFWESIGITSMAYDPTDPMVFYVGTGESAGGATRGEGIYKTTDGGNTWTQLASTEEFFYVNDIVVRNEDGIGVIYAAVAPTYYRGDFHGVPDLGLQRSINGGTSFDQVFPDISVDEVTPHAIADLELAADNSLWAGTVQNVYGEGGGYILTSTDGTTWEVSTQRSPGNRIMLSSAPSNSSVLYALVESSGEVEEVIKTTDGGATWNNLSEPDDADGNIDAGDFSRGQAWYDLIIRVDPNDENSVLVGAIDLFKTSDGGSTWDQVSHWYGGFGFQYVHADQHAILFEPGSSSNVLFGNDGGVFVSSNMDATNPTINARNNSYNVTQFYSCAIHPTQKDYYLAGSQDNGTQQFLDPGISSTRDIFGGDGAFCFIDQSNGNFQISSYVYNVYGLSTNNGIGPFGSFADDQSTGRFINPADYDDTLGILFTATDGSSIGRYTNIRTGSPGRDDFSISLGDIASHLRVSPYQTSSTTLFVGTGAGNLYKIEGAEGDSPAPTDITANLPEGYISCIEIGASEDHLLATYSNYGVTQVWETTDGGSTWVEKNGNLPDMPVRWALFNPNNRREVILATELGIWRTENIDITNPVWEPSNIGLANVRVDMLQIRNSDSEVIAATHGRGLYSSKGFTLSEAPDLQITEFSIEQNVDQINLSSSISNLGFLDIESDIEFTVYWSFSESFDPENANEFFSTIISGGLAIDASDLITESLDIPADFVSGTIHFFAFLDENGSVTEYDEENNSATASIEFIPLAANNSKKNLYNVYPIPFVNQLTIESGRDGSSFSYRLVDLAGKTILTDHSSNSKVELNMSYLGKGVYHLVIVGEKGQETFKAFKK